MGLVKPHLCGGARFAIRCTTTEVKQLYSSQMKEDIPEYFLSRKHLWVDKDLKPTTEWAKAEFIMEGSLPVRMAKPGSFHAWIHDFRKTE